MNQPFQSLVIQARNRVRVVGLVHMVS